MIEIQCYTNGEMDNYINYSGTLKSALNKAQVPEKSLLHVRYLPLVLVVQLSDWGVL